MLTEVTVAPAAGKMPETGAARVPAMTGCVDGTPLAGITPARVDVPVRVIWLEPAAMVPVTVTTLEARAGVFSRTVMVPIAPDADEMTQVGAAGKGGLAGRYPGADTARPATSPVTLDMVVMSALPAVKTP